MPSVGWSAEVSAEQGGCRGLSAWPARKRRRPGAQRQQADVVVPPDRRALLQRVIAPIRQEQARRGERRRRVHGLERLEQILDEPETLRTRLQPVRSGQPSQCLRFGYGAPWLAADDRKPAEPRILRGEQRAGEPLGLRRHDGDRCAALEDLDQSGDATGVKTVVTDT